MVPVASAVEETQLSGFVGAIYFIRNGVKGIVFNGIILKVLQVKFWVELTVLTRKNKIVVENIPRNYLSVESFAWLKDNIR
jgi:hypothetical protein